MHATSGCGLKSLTVLDSSRVVKMAKTPVKHDKINVVEHIVENIAQNME